MSRRSVIVKCAALVSVVVGGMAVRNVWLPRQEAPSVGVGRLGCEQVANRLDCYISGNIDCCDQIKAIEAHLAVCRSCSQLHLIKLGNLATAKRDI